MNPADRIKKLRKAMGITQIQLAKMIEVSPTKIQKIEKGQSITNYEDVIRKIAKVCGCAPEYLMVPDSTKVQAMHMLFTLFSEYEGAFVLDHENDIVGITFKELDSLIKDWKINYETLQGELDNDSSKESINRIGTNYNNYTQKYPELIKESSLKESLNTNEKTKGLNLREVANRLNNYKELMSSD